MTSTHKTFVMTVLMGIGMAAAPLPAFGELIYYELSGTLTHDPQSAPDVAGYDGIDFEIVAELDATATRSWTNNINVDQFEANAVTLIIDPNGSPHGPLPEIPSYVQWIIGATDDLHFNLFVEDLFLPDHETHIVSVSGLQFPTGKYGPLSPTTTLPEFDQSEIVGVTTFSVFTPDPIMSADYTVSNMVARGYVVPEPVTATWAMTALAWGLVRRRGQ